MQVEIHKATVNKIPGGWDNQIRNDIILNYRLDYERHLYSYSNLFTMNTKASVQVGTLFNNASLGINGSVGFLNSVFSSSIKQRSLQTYLYAQPLLSIVAYDATLQGSMFNKNSPYTLHGAQVERMTTQLNYGLVLKARTLYFEYAQTILSKGFESGSTAKWGGIKIGFTF